MFTLTCAEFQVYAYAVGNKPDEPDNDTEPDKAGFRFIRTAEIRPYGPYGMNEHGDDSDKSGNGMDGIVQAGEVCNVFHQGRTCGIGA